MDIKICCLSHFLMQSNARARPRIHKKRTAAKGGVGLGKLFSGEKGTWHLSLGLCISAPFKSANSIIRHIHRSRVLGVRGSSLLTASLEWRGIGPLNRPNIPVEFRWPFFGPRPTLIIWHLAMLACYCHCSSTPSIHPSNPKASIFHTSIHWLIDWSDCPQA